MWLYQGGHFFPPSLYTTSHTLNPIFKWMEQSSQVKVKAPTYQVRWSETLVCPDSRTAKASPASLRFSWLGQSFGVALGLQRKFIWGMHARGRWPPMFCHDVERAIRSGLIGGVLVPETLLLRLDWYLWCGEVLVSKNYHSKPYAIDFCISKKFYSC